jgi:hypothetical protein
MVPSIRCTSISITVICSSERIIAGLGGEEDRMLHELRKLAEIIIANKNEVPILQKLNTNF